MYKPGKPGLFIVIGITVLTFFVVFSFSCKVAPKNACEISNDDAAVFFGNVKLFASDKSNLLIEEGKNDPNIRSCSFRTDEHMGVPSLRWTSFEGKTEQEAKENFDRVKKMPGSVDIAGIGNEAYLKRSEDSGKEISVTVRKGKNVFLVILNSENSSEKAVENVKALARKIADKTSE